jgi:MFS family permease
LLLSTALFGIATLLAATATSVATLALWRFITGIGLGGALTTATALVAEFSPAQISRASDRRNTNGRTDRRHDWCSAGR